MSMANVNCQLIEDSRWFNYHIRYVMNIKKIASLCLCTAVFCLNSGVLGSALAEEEGKVKRISFPLWKDVLREEALAFGISGATYDEATHGTSCRCFKARHLSFSGSFSGLQFLVTLTI